jgi:hypothetical protein
MCALFVKIFSQILDSSIAEDYLVRLVFEDMLKLADRDGFVDMTAGAIARRTNVPLEIVSRGIEKLAEPDPESRSPEEEGRRIVLIDPHRPWGWRIVNYMHYRVIRDDETRREQNRESQRRHRERDKSVTKCDGQQMSASVSNGKPRQPMSAQVEEEAEADVDVKTISPRRKADGGVSEDLCSRIYDLYPRKVGRRDALAAIGKAIAQLRQGEGAQGMSRDEAITFLTQRTETFAKSPAGQRGKFTPHPATWFNQSRYLDDPAEWKADSDLREPKPSPTKERIDATRRKLVEKLEERGILDFKDAQKEAITRRCERVAASSSGSVVEGSIPASEPSGIG